MVPLIILLISTFALISIFGFILILHSEPTHLIKCGTDAKTTTGFLVFFTVSVCLVIGLFISAATVL